jgi:hypothetical protein
MVDGNPCKDCKGAEASVIWERNGDVEIPGVSPGLTNFGGRFVRMFGSLALDRDEEAAG